eukprot:10210720-Heterocapsa_arctica.AAC.1
MLPRPEYATRTGTGITRRTCRPKVELQSMAILRVRRTGYKNKLHLPNMFRNTRSGITLGIFNTP